MQIIKNFFKITLFLSFLGQSINAECCTFYLAKKTISALAKTSLSMSKKLLVVESNLFVKKPAAFAIANGIAIASIIYFHNKIKEDAKKTLHSAKKVFDKWLDVAKDRAVYCALGFAAGLIFSNSR